MTTPQAMQMLEELESSVFEYNQDPSRFIGMLFGEPGAGKSIAALALAQGITPPDKTIFTVDTSDAWVSVRNHPPLQHRARIVPYENLTKLRGYAGAISQKVGSFSNVGCVIFDEVSSILAEQISMVADHREQSATKATNLVEGQYDRADYGIAGNKLKKMLLSYLAIPNMHIIMTAHSRRDKDKSDIEVSRINVHQQADIDLQRIIHLVGYLRADLKKKGVGDTYYYDRTIQVYGTSKIIAKTKIGGLKPLITLPELIVGIKDWLGDQSPTEKEPSTETVEEFEGIEIP